MAKIFVTALVAILGLSSFAQAQGAPLPQPEPASRKCIDSNFDGVEGNWDELKYRNRFQNLFSHYPAPAPAGYDIFGTNGSICFATRATYFKHIPSKKVYAMFTTHDDYCDGGNTVGIIIDTELYGQQKLEESVIARISDGEFYCEEKK